MDPKLTFNLKYRQQIVCSEVSVFITMSQPAVSVVFIMVRLVGSGG